MRPSLVARLLALSLVLLASPAAAGPLSKVVRGVENKVDTHRPSPPEDRPDPPSSDGDDDSSPGYDQPGGTHFYYVHDDRSSCDGDCGSVRIYGGAGGEARGELLPGPARLDLYLGAHAVVGSQGAFVGDLRLSKGWLGASLSRSSYFERVEGDDGKRGDQSVRMDLLSLAANVRLFSEGPTALWLDGGLGATSSSEYDTLLGGMVGARLEHRLRPQLGVAAMGRLYRLQYDVSAAEGWAGVQAWFLRAGYRALRFNVGPALHGPEAGVAFAF